jgi:hypothetical protein
LEKKGWSRGVEEAADGRSAENRVGWGIEKTDSGFDGRWIAKSEMEYAQGAVEVELIS